MRPLACLLAVAIVVVAGCKKPDEPQPSPIQNSSMTKPAGDDIHPILPSSGVANGPVVGGQEIGDSGGSVGQAAKDKAKKAASKAASSSLGQTTGDEN